MRKQNVLGFLTTKPRLKNRNYIDKTTTVGHKIYVETKKRMFVSAVVTYQ
jgi:hypothetical protein